MRRIEGYFHLLHTTESLLGAPEVHGDDLIVPVKQLYPLRGHPLTEVSSEHFCGRMIFRHVVSSSRTVRDLGPQSNLSSDRPPTCEADGPFLTEDGPNISEFAFEGIREYPPAWVDWIVRAESFCLEVYGT